MVKVSGSLLVGVLVTFSTTAWQLPVPSFRTRNPPAPGGAMVASRRSRVTGQSTRLCICSCQIGCRCRICCSSTALRMISDPDFDDYDNEDIEFSPLMPSDDDLDELPDLLGSGDDDGDSEDEDDLEGLISNIEGLSELDDAGEEAAAANIMTWAEKRQKKLEGGMKTRRRTWEEKFEDDPLRSESPTTDLEVKPHIPYETLYIVSGEVTSADMLLKRQEAWMQHLQWVRRNTLTSKQDKKVQIEWEYTTLSQDSIAPNGQVVAIWGNSTADVRELLETEPLFANGGINAWKLYEYSQVKQDEVMCAMKDPFLFIGNVHSKPSDTLLAEQLEYHSKAGNKVVSMGTLNALEKGAKDQIMIVFNSKTVKGAERYVEQDPLVKSGDVRVPSPAVSPFNVQDIDGLHHLMPRSFDEARELNQLHFMDPCDLLELEVKPLKSLPNHSIENARVVSAIKAENRVPNYIRHNMIERFGSLELHDSLTLSISEMIQAQKERLSVSDNVGDDGDVVDSSEEGPETGSDD